MNKNLNENKFDVEELIKEFRVLNINTFGSYLKEIYRVLNF
jgi:hypothetical protein